MAVWFDAAIGSGNAQFLLSRGGLDFGRVFVHDGKALCGKSGVPWKGTQPQWVRIPPGNWSLQPVAIEAAVEVTKPSKPSV